MNKANFGGTVMLFITRGKMDCEKIQLVMEKILFSTRKEKWDCEDSPYQDPKHFPHRRKTGTQQVQTLRQKCSAYMQKEVLTFNNKNNLKILSSHSRDCRS
jgi:hypothetical protein